MNGIFVRQEPNVQKENVHIGKRRDFARRVCELERMTAQRAHEIFERKGWTHGHDLDDWFEAQEELFVPMRGEVVESEFSLEWIAEVGGFHASDLEVHVEPHRLVILGRRMARGTPYRSEPTVHRDHEKEIYRVIDLPVEVDPVMVTANIENGVLKVFLLKAGNPLERMTLAVAA